MTWFRNRRGGRTARAGAVSAAVLACLMRGSGVADAESATDRSIRSSANDERPPAAGAGYLAWAENSHASPRRYGLYVNRFDGAPHRVNPAGTSAFAGGI